MTLEAFLQLPNTEILGFRAVMLADQYWAYEVLEFSVLEEVVAE